MTAAMPGISDCFDIGDAGLCGGLCEATGATPGAWRCGGGGGADPAFRSAVSAIMATVTPGMARTAASAWARTLSHARASAASTLIEKNTLPSVTDIADSTLALVKATSRGDADSQWREISDTQLRRQEVGEYVARHESCRGEAADGEQAELCQAGKTRR